MEFQSYLSWISSPVQIAFLDLVLGADNAIIIALVCRSLPRHQRVNVMVVGTGAAMLLRIVLTALTGALMFVPLLRLAGGLMLMLIAVSLTDELDVGPVADGAAEPDTPRDAQAESEAFWDAILLVVLADGVMSLDNTVALAAVAQGNMLYLVLGLALSVPTLVFGSWLLTELLGKTPFLGSVAMGVLAWVAGDMAVSDPLVAGWIQTTAPALNFAVPIAAVIFVLAKGAFRPVVVPIAVTGPVAGLDFAGERTPSEGAIAPRSLVEPIAEPEQQPEPQEAIAPELVPVASDVHLAALGTDQIAAEQSGGVAAIPARPPEERLVVIGLIVLFGVAAVIIGSAIYFGGATF